MVAQILPSLVAQSNSGLKVVEKIRTHGDMVSLSYFLFSASTTLLSGRKAFRKEVMHQLSSVAYTTWQDFPEVTHFQDITEIIAKMNYMVTFHLP